MFNKNVFARYAFLNSTLWPAMYRGNKLPDTWKDPAFRAAADVFGKHRCLGGYAEESECNLYYFAKEISMGVFHLQQLERGKNAGQ